MEYRVELANIDISRWVINKPGVVYTKNRLGELAEIPNAEILVDNGYHVFTPFHAQSIIQDERERTLEIYEDDLLIYEGLLRHSRINTQDKTATLQTTARINRIVGNIMTPVNDLTIQSFAEISEYLYTLYNIEIDNVSYYRTQKKQQDLGLLGWINHTYEHGSSVMEIQQFLANAGFSKHYFIGNKAYMEFVDPFETVYPIYTFTDDDIITIDNYTPLEKVPYDGYVVNTAAGSATKIGLNMAPNLDCDPSRPIIMATPSGGYYWGDYQIELAAKLQNEITLRLVKSKYAYWLGMQTTFEIDSTSEGINETFIVTSIDKSDDIAVVVTGETA